MLQGSLVVGGISSGALAATRVPVALCLGAGLVLGLLAVASAIYLEPLLARHLRTPQPYLSLSVHGLPALLGGLLGVALAAVSEEKAGLLNYSISLYTLYPGRAPPAGWTCVTNKTVAEILLCPSSGDQVHPPCPAPLPRPPHLRAQGRSLLHPDLPTSHWSALQQAGMQAAATTTAVLLGLAR